MVQEDPQADRERGSGARSAEGSERSRNHRVAVDDERTDVGVREARERFGGLDLPATFVGMLTALGLLIVASGLVAAALGAIGYQRGLKNTPTELSVASLVGGLILLLVAFLVGGWAAGRIARYDGARNGLMTGVWTLVLGAIVSALAAWLGQKYDVLRNVDLPQWFSTDSLTVGGIVSAIVAIAAMLVGGLLGGILGERYHRRADAAIVATRPGGVITPGRARR